jgi:hypothetical protein
MNIWKTLGQLWQIECSVKMEMYSVEFNIVVAINHIWLQSCWNVATETKERKFKLF